MTALWIASAFFAGMGVGVLVMHLVTVAAEDEWKTAYLNCRDRLYHLEREQEHA